jgi:hypothetical protein
MAKLIDVDLAIEIADLLKRRRNLLLEKCKTEEESKSNYLLRQSIRKKLFSLTQNPIYIHF